MKLFFLALQFLCLFSKLLQFSKLRQFSKLFQLFKVANSQFIMKKFQCHLI